MARPLKIVSDGLRELSDADLDAICYYTRVAYANQLNANGNGYVYVGAGNTSIGSMSDTSSTRQTNSQTRNYSGGTDYPAYPGIGVETDASYSYRQLRGTPGFPSAATLNASGYMIVEGTDGVRVVNTEAQIFAEVIAQTIADMRTGDEVGTYRVATTTPAGGTWTNKGTWFADTTYSAGTTTYKLYLKRSDTAPGVVRPLVLSGSEVSETTGTFNENHAMIQNILLPALTRRLGSGDLNYTVATTGSISRGAFSNTRQTSASNTRFFTNPVYYSRSTPTGGSVVQETKRLYLA